MNYLKRWWYGEEAAEQPEQQTPTTQPRRKSGPPVEPLLRDVPGGGGDVQGLGWYQRSLLQDEDGDCATDFLEEPQRQAPNSAEPAPKKPHLATLQSAKSRASPAKIASLAIHQGHVRTDRERSLPER